MVGSDGRRGPEVWAVVREAAGQVGLVNARGVLRAPVVGVLVASLADWCSSSATRRLSAEWCRSWRASSESAWWWSLSCRSDVRPSCRRCVPRTERDGAAGVRVLRAGSWRLSVGAAVGARPGTGRAGLYVAWALVGPASPPRSGSRLSLSGLLMIGLVVLYVRGPLVPRDHDNG